MAAQTELRGLEDPAEIEAEIEQGYLWREELYHAMRQCVRELGGYGPVANELDRRWGPKGRPVSATFLRAALNDTERNSARIEWLHFFKARSREVAQLLASGCKPSKTPAELLEDLEAELREELSHRRAEAVLRRARAR